MKTRLMAAATALSTSVLLLAAPSVFAGHGGGHGGGGLVGGGGGGRGNPGYSGGYSRGVSGYSGYSNYSSGLRGYPGGGLGRVYSGYGQRSYSPQSSYSGRVHSSYPSHRAATSGRQFYSSQKSSGQHVNRSQPTLNQSNRFAKSEQLRGAYGNRSVQRNARTGFVSKTNLTTRDGQNHQGNWARNNSSNKNRFGQQTQDRLRNWQGHRSNFAEASQRNHEHHDGHHHNHDWWHHHCGAIILVDWGWWGWWDGWWYPAWGYDPYYSYYAYDGPIYGYDGLPPDEVIANVQGELQSLGYYSYGIDGILGPLTREALMRYQRDRGLPVTGAIDPETVGSLGLG
jgi:hypothetical protein